MPKTAAKLKKMVWRMSVTTPKGEWVDPARVVPPLPRLAEPEVSTGSWVTSSFDLLNGTDVIEDPVALTPGLFNELFKPQRKEPERPGE